MKFKILPCLMAAALCSCGSAEGEEKGVERNHAGNA